MVGIDYRCSACGREHSGTDGGKESPWPALSFQRPDRYVALPRHRRRHHAAATNDLCWIADGQGVRCFVRGCLSLPIIGEDITLEYGLWAEVSEEVFLDYQLHFEDTEGGATYVGAPANEIPGYEGTEVVPLQIECLPFPHRPRLRPDSLHGHLLARDAHSGISRAEAELRIRAFLLGRDGATPPGLEG
ncbi:MAG: DUF2199 domain-containing protein [Brachybacterium sp.]|uniref:DUF2199 domain-containing protein n=1 Tax=unclassified Brachybacterium TaxID=2623841 RepID=UPI00264BE001|nr:DUF2199 domain-containing protein [Brachybacterium sp.]MDN6328938.1 DUF2199 domain-containing protein [Brachybacterium sp.]MDN6400821.1 DUF2199 domain-containing protein [Brachybacterium sp.]